MEVIDIKCINCCRSTGLYLKDKTAQDMITQFVLDTVLLHVGLSWIISSNKQMEYYIKENNHDWLNKCPWYNTEIYSKLHVTVFEYYIRNDRTDRYNIMCSITAHDKLIPTYIDDATSGDGRAIPDNSTKAALESLGATLNFIYCWLKHFHHNYQVIWKMYNEAVCL